MVGVDLAEAFISAAAARMQVVGLAGVVRVQQGDACQLPFADASFDAVHCERMLTHLEQPVLALRGAARVLRPCGVMVVAEPDWAGFRTDLAMRADFDVLYARLLPQRQADMGLTLYRRFAEAGFTEGQAAPIWSHFTDWRRCA